MIEKAFDYDCPVRWAADSKKGITALPVYIHRLVIQSRIHAAPLLSASNPYAVGWDVSIQTAGFNVKFKKTDYGCQLEAYIFEDNDDTRFFSHIWKELVDRGYMWGGPYIKPLEVETQAQEGSTSAPCALSWQKEFRKYSPASQMKIYFFCAMLALKEEFSYSGIARVLWAFSPKEIDEYAKANGTFCNWCRNKLREEFEFNEKEKMGDRHKGFDQKTLNAFYNREHK